MTHLTIKLGEQKLKKLEKSASKAGDALRNKSIAMKKVSIFLDRWVQENFRSEGGNVGKWEPFAMGGRMKKGLFDSSAKLLQDTGALRASYRPFSTNNNAGIGSDSKYSKAHDKGLGVPERRTLPVAEEVDKDVRDILSDYVESNVVKNITQALRS